MLLGSRSVNATARPLPPAIQLQMEMLFRTSFSDVTCKVGPEPLSIGARAFASGTRLFFAPGAWDPHSRETRALIAHELSHVVQQRSRRLMSRFGARAGVVYDDALEAEADGMAEEATRCLKGRASGPAAVRHGMLDLGQPFEIWEGSYQIAACIGSRLAGSVHVHECGAAAIEVTDLKVRPEFRRRGIGRILIQSALQTGLHLARTYAVLASGDSGTGRLSRWYERLGFSKSGFQRGYTEYAAKISRALSGIALFTAPPLCGQLIQCMDMDDDERRRRRGERFPLTPDQAQKQQVEQQHRNTENRRLTQLFLAALHEKIDIRTYTEVKNDALKHGDRDPAKTFFDAYYNVAGRGDFSSVEIEDKNGEEIVITFRLGNGWTVAGSYSFRNKTFTIFHSGRTASGVGYGTNLRNY